MSTTTHRPTLSDVIGDTDLTAAETDFMACCKSGNVKVYGDNLPKDGTQQNTLRADLIRHMLLGGCDEGEIHAKGVQIVGAWITGVLDLEGCETTLDLKLAQCRFCEVPVFSDARLASVMLPGCHVPGVAAQRLKVTRNVMFNQKFNATGQVNLSGAQIGGQLACVDARFNGGDGADAVALMCNAMTVGADVFLRDGFEATGQVHLMRAQIGGHLQCHRARFGHIFVGEGMAVTGGFYWQDVTAPPKVMNLCDAQVGALRDDVESWDGCEPVLNGFRYDRIISEVTVAERLAWLARKREVEIKAGLLVEGKPLPWVNGVGRAKFDSQPYSQLAKVLRKQGHASGSARVLVVRERLQRRAAFWRAQAGLDGSVAAGMLSVFGAMRRPFDWAFGLVFGFGHQPARALVLVAGILAVCYWLYGAAYDAGQMAPNSDVVLTSKEWQAAADAGCGTVKKPDCKMPLDLWLASHTATDYETFNRGLYALDLFVPLDALGQENAWAPSKDRGGLGWWAYYLRWAVQMSGWVITAVAAAALTGVIGRKE